MRVMVLVKATEDSEQGFVPTPEALAAMEEMGRFNDELRDAGILVAADGLRPSLAGKRARRAGCQARRCELPAFDQACRIRRPRRRPFSHLPGGNMTRHRICSVSVASVYPHYVAKAEKKGRTRAEVDEIICWLTGHSRETLDDELNDKTSFEDFFARAPRMNPARSLITGTVCGVRVEEVEEPMMREIRYLDKLVDELAKGKAMEKILRK